MSGVGDRAAGALLGVHAGDSLGATLEFESAEACRAAHPGGLRDIVGGGPFGWEPGQPTDDTDLTWAVAAGYLDADFRPPVVDHAARHLLAWLDGGPLDVGGTTAAALARYRASGDPTTSGGRGEGDQANGSLMRTMPVAVARATEPDLLVSEAGALSAVTHAHPVCLDACVSYCTLAAELILGRDVAAAVDRAAAVASTPPVVGALAAASRADGLGFGDLSGPQGGYVLWALQVSVRAVLTAPDVEEGVVAVVMLGGDTDTNGAIAGGLLGARFGLSAIPDRWVSTLQLAEPLRRFAASAVARWPG